MFRKIALLLSVLVMLAALGVWWWLQSLERWMDTPMAVVAETEVSLEPGTNLMRFSTMLEEHGLLAQSAHLKMYLRLHRLGHKVHAGQYLLTPGMTPRELVGLLVSGRVVEYSITLPEGRTLAQTLATLHADERIVATLDSGSVYEVGEWLGEEFDFPAAEGAFFPDTYRFQRGQSDADILRRAWQRMRSVLAEEWAARDDGLPLTSAWEALILASIIERESGRVDERARIAGVFVRRLQRDMRLQTDPTVIYGLGESFDGNLTRAHLREEGPFNTYVNKGLPPTPIALPGRASIHAALHPAQGAELYFVARGDGSHAFSSTLAEHRVAVRQFQLNRTKNYRSSP